VAEGSSPLSQVQGGQEGELCIGGVGVALGYLHAPDLTAQVCKPYLFVLYGLVSDCE